MGQMRFQAPTPEKYSSELVQRAYLAGLEAIPWCSRNSWSDGCLLVERASSESGCLYVPWNIDGVANRVLSTCNLMDRPAPYCLPLEVARGTLHRARAVAAELEFRGTNVPAEISRLVQDALQEFLQATTSQRCEDLPAEHVIQVAYQAMRQLVELDSRKKLAERQQRESRFPTLLAGRIDEWPLTDAAQQHFLRAFNSACVSFNWREIQPTPGRFEWDCVEEQVAWCQQHQLQVVGGPLLKLDSRNLPEWIPTDSGNYQPFENALVEFVGQVTRRYDQRVALWCCASGLNVQSAAGFCEELKLRLAVASIESVKRSVAHTPVIIHFDQPWAEYLVTEDFDLSPLHFADALVRADLGLAGVGLEMNLGYWPGGTLPRDLLDISRHIDRWSQLGIPLVLQVTIPSAAGPDPQAIGPTQVVTVPANDGPRPAIDQLEIEHLLPLFCTKPAVQGMIWGQLSDRAIHYLPHAGLLDATGQAKPLLQRLAAFREEYLH
jgi:hypothetical protein